MFSIKLAVGFVRTYFVRLSGVEAHVPIGAPFDSAQGDKD